MLLPGTRIVGTIVRRRATCPRRRLPAHVHALPRRRHHGEPEARQPLVSRAVSARAVVVEAARGPRWRRVGAGGVEAPQELGEPLVGDGALLPGELAGVLPGEGLVDVCLVMEVATHEVLVTQLLLPSEPLHTCTGEGVCVAGQPVGLHVKLAEARSA